MSAKLYSYEVIFVDDDGETVKRVVMARHEFEATQLAGAFGKVVRSVVNQDL